MAPPRTKRRVVSQRKKPRQARSQTTVAAILSAAARIFESHGYAAGTTNRIAERAGVSIGSLYEYFPSKDAILLALARRHLAEGVAIVGTMLAEAKATESVTVFLLRVVTAMVRLHEHEPRLHRVLFEETPLPALLRREIADGEARIVLAVAELLTDRGLVPPEGARIKAYVAVHLVESMTHRFVLYPPQACDAPRFIDEIVALLSRYLA